MPLEIALTVVIDETVIAEAMREMLRQGAPTVEDFPPADHEMPCATAVHTAVSARVANVGIEVLIPQGCLDSAIDQLIREQPQARAVIDRYAKELVSRLQYPMLETAPGTDPVDQALDDVYPEYLVTLSPSRRARHRADPQSVTPPFWVRAANAVVRTTP